MKSLRVLLKIAKRDLETLRRALGEANRRVADVEARAQELEANVAVERVLAARDYESTRAFSAYTLLAARRREVLEGERKAIEAEIEDLRKLIADAHVEMRKFERLIELDEAREKAQREKREDAALDEMATLRAGRLRPA